MAGEDTGPRKKQKNANNVEEWIIATPLQSLSDQMRNLSLVTHPKSLPNPIFKAACDGQWKEEEEGIVRLPEADAGTFPAYLHWVYTSEMSLSEVKKDAARNEDCLLFLAKLWVFGDMLLDRHWCNKIMHCIFYTIDDNKEVPDAETINYICDHTAANSELRQVHLAKCAYVLQDKTVFRFFADHWPHEFAMDVAEELITSTPNAPSADEPYESHIHEVDEECDNEIDFDETYETLGG